MSDQRSGLTGTPQSLITEIAGVPLVEYGDTMRIEGVIVGDGHKNVMLFLPGELKYPFVHVAPFEMTLDEALAWLRQSDDPMAPTYVEGDDGARIVKAIVRKSTRQVDQNVAWACYARDGFECQYCGAINVPFTYDHWLAQAFGGRTTIENGVTACRPCNKAKGHMTTEEWVAFMYEKGYKYADKWATAKSS